VPITLARGFDFTSFYRYYPSLRLRENNIFISPDQTPPSKIKEQSQIAHRINLRGPWTCAISDQVTAGQILVAKRKFHRPSSGKRFFLYVQHAPGFPIHSITLNDAPLSLVTETDDPLVLGTEVTGILEVFNLITIQWDHWPKEIMTDIDVAQVTQATSVREIRYTPSPTHPLHIDSWLEIQE
jgi:hypothetical protein